MVPPRRNCILEPLFQIGLLRQGALDFLRGDDERTGPHGVGRHGPLVEDEDELAVLDVEGLVPADVEVLLQLLQEVGLLT